MTKKRSKGSILYLGDEKFNKKISVYYSWVAPTVLFILSCVLFFDKAFFTGLILLILSLFIAPLTKKYTSRLPGLFRLLVILGLIYLAFYSIRLYI